MRSSSGRWAALSLLPAVVGAAGGCFVWSVDDRVPVACTADSDCPTGFVCRPAVERCFSVTGADLDEAAPSFVAGPEVYPLLVGLPQDDAPALITIELEVDEPLFRAPSATFTADGVERAFVPQDVDPESPGDTLAFRLVYSADGSEPQGADLPVEVEIVDRSGNDARVTVGPIRFDRVPPALVGASTISPNPAPAGPVEVSFRVDELLSAAALRAEADGSSFPFQLESTLDEEELRFSGTIDDGAAEGAYELVAELTDKAGNRAELAAGTLTVDRTPPGATLTLEPSAITSSGVAGLTIAVDELPSDDLPTVVMSQPGGPEIEWTADNGGEVIRIAQSQTFSATFSPATALEGELTVEVRGLTDQAGNVADPLPVDEPLIIDSQGPDVTVTDLTPRVSPNPGFDVLEVVAGVSDEGSAVSAVTLAVDGVAQPAPTCDGAGDPGGVVTCTAAVDEALLGEEPALIDDERALALTLQARDAAGNIGVATASVIFDGRAPVVLDQDVDIEGGPSSALDEPAAAGLGAQLEITAVVAEQLASASTTGELVCGAESVPLDTLEVTGFAAAGSLSIDGAPAEDGPCEVVLHLVDEAGNALDLLVDTVVIDRAPPVAAAAIDASRARHIRAPWGADDTEGEPFSAIASPSWTLAADLAADSLPADLATASVATILVYPGSSADLVAGRLARRDDDTWPAAALATADTDGLWLAAVDEAGNESADRVRVELGEWVATLDGKVPGDPLSNPHRLELRPRLGGPVREGYAEAAAPADASVISTQGWHTAPLPTGGIIEGKSRIAYDGTVGAYVSLSGERLAGGEIDTVPLDDPEGDGQPGSAFGLLYDDRRNRTVAVAREGLWVFTGRSWRLEPSVSGIQPPVLNDPAVAYDRARDVFVLFGGATGSYDGLFADGETDAIWELAEGGWILRDDVPAGPSARSAAALVWHEARGELLLHGGHGGVDCPPVPDEHGEASLPGLADQYVGAFVAMNRVCDDLWSYDGATWTLLDSGHPRAGHGAVYDPAAESLVLAGGAGCSVITTPIEGSILGILLEGDLSLYLCREVTAWALESGFTTLPHPLLEEEVGISSSLARGTGGELTFRVGEGFEGTFEAQGTRIDVEVGARRRSVAFGPDGTRRWVTDGAYLGEGERTLGVAHDSGSILVVDPTGSSELATPRGLNTLPYWGGNVAPPLALTFGIAHAALVRMASDTLVVVDDGETYTSPQAWFYDGPSAETWSRVCDAPACTVEPGPVDFATTGNLADSGAWLFGTDQGSFDVWAFDPATLDFTDACASSGCLSSRPPALEGAAVLEDEDNGRILIAGASSDDPVLRLWTFDGTAFTELCTSQPCAATRPPKRRWSSMGFGQDAGTYVVSGGSTFGGELLDDIWVYDDATWAQLPARLARPTMKHLTLDTFRYGTAFFGGQLDPLREDRGYYIDRDADGRNAHVLRLMPRLTGFDLAQTDIETLTTTWAAGGDGPQGSGSELWLFRAGRWVLLDSNAASTAAPGTLSATVDIAPHDDVVIDADGSLALAVTPVSGVEDDETVVATDGAEVRVRYRYPPRVATP